MSKKTLALIIFLFLVTCGLLYFAIQTPPYQKQRPSSPTPTPLSVNAHTLLSLSQVSASESSLLQSSGQVKAGQYVVAVNIDTGDNLVNSVQLELAYDPQALTNVSMNVGKFFEQPSTLVNTVDTTDGRISYATTEQINLPGKKGTGVLAYISFSLSPTFTTSSTTITFLPKTAVAADKVLESVLKKTSGFTLVVPTATVTPSVTINSISPTIVPTQ